MLDKKSDSALTGNRKSASKEAAKATRKAYSWRKFLGAITVAIAMAAFALFLLVMPSNAQNYDTSLKGRSDVSASDPGPENVPLVNANPNAFLRPPTDHGGVQSFWNYVFGAMPANGTVATSPQLARQFPQRLPRLREWAATNVK